MDHHPRALLLDMGGVLLRERADRQPSAVIAGCGPSTGPTRTRRTPGSGFFSQEG
jgi:hypothetical protein